MDLAIQAAGSALGYPGLGRVAGSAYRMYRRSSTGSNGMVSDPGVSGNPSGFGGVFHGKFRGRVKRPRRTNRIYRGFKEKVIFSGRSTQSKCWYMNLQSCPMPITDAVPAINASNAVPGIYPLPEGGVNEDRYIPRVLIDICIAIVREFYKKYHPGRVEFTSPDDQVANYLRYIPAATGVSTEGVAVQGEGLLGEVLCYVYNNADGSGLSNQEINVFSNGTETLMEIGTRLAYWMWVKWKEGSVPYALIAQTKDYGDNHASSRGTMHLGQLVVSCKVFNKLMLQNITKGENNETAITDINMDPLKGKVFYHRGLAPSVTVGNVINPSSAVVDADEWFQDYMAFPTLDNPSTPAGDVVASTLGNITVPTNMTGTGASTAAAVGAIAIPPTGCWVTVPKPEYFKRCVGVRDVTLEPGVMRSLDLSFKFSGFLTTLLSKFQNEYAYNVTQPWNTTNIGYKYPIGNCLTIALEKRMRFDPNEDVPISIAFQLETVITADIKTKKQGMTYNVVTNY